MASLLCAFSFCGLFLVRNVDPFLGTRVDGISKRRFLGCLRAGRRMWNYGFLIVKCVSKQFQLTCELGNAFVVLSIARPQTGQRSRTVCVFISKWLKCTIVLAALSKAPHIEAATCHVFGVTADTPRAASPHAAAVRRAGQNGAPAAVADGFHGPQSQLFHKFHCVLCDIG